MKRYLVVPLLALLAACDGATGPEPVRKVQILLGTTPVDSQSIQVANSVKLTATTSDAAGRPLQGRKVTWRSTAPTIADVDSTGTVTGRAPGSALVIASADQAADTVRFLVSLPPPASLECQPNQPRLTLAPGQVHTTTAVDAHLLCLPGGGEYTYIAFNAATSGSLLVEVAGGNVTGVTGPPTPGLLPGEAPARLSLAGARPTAEEDWGFHLRLRQWERQNLGLMRASAAEGAARRSVAAAVPQVGDLLRLNTSASTSCTDTTSFRPARVEAVSRHAVVAADTTNPAGGLSRTDYAQIAATFDTLVWPVVTGNFGTPSDIDQNERVIIFFTRAVNELTQPGSGSFVGGFYHPRDLRQRTGTGSCAASNVAEVLYQLVADPQRAQQESPNDPARSPFSVESVRNRTISVVAHELQHLINASRRAFVNSATIGEEVWLNEGLSHIAEELLFFASTPVLPRQNVTVERIRSQEQIRLAFNAYQSSNFGRFVSYLRNPSAASLAGVDDLPTRGASWAFLRYAADRKAEPSAQRQIWFGLANSQTAGIANLTNVLGVNPFDWMQDWTVSVYTDDTGLAQDVRFQQPSWNFRDILSALTTDRTYPLQVLTLQSGAENQRKVTLLPGGATFIRFGTTAGQDAPIRTTSNQIPGPQRLRVSIVRTR